MRTNSHQSKDSFGERPQLFSKPGVPGGPLLSKNVSSSWFSSCSPLGEEMHVDSWSGLGLLQGQLLEDH